MKNVLLIWIPSIQKHLHFYELSNAQYRVILKNLPDKSNLNFLYNLNTIIQDNLVSDYLAGSFTVIDRFIIVTYLKIHAVGKDLQLQRQCEKCSADTKLYLDLDNMLIFLSDKIDRSFREEINVEGYPVTIVCDVPTIQREYDTLLSGADMNIDATSFDYRLHKYLTSFIAGIKTVDTYYEVSGLDQVQQNALLTKIPHIVMEHIKSQYLQNIYDIFNQVVFFKFHCEKCSEEFELKLQFDNITEITKLIFRDCSVDVLLGDYFSIASATHLDGTYLDRISYSEVKELIQFIKMNNSHSDNQPPVDSGPDGDDLFAHYGSEVAHMERRPSEL